MKVKKILGFIAPVAKDKEEIQDTEIFSHEIKKSNKLYSFLELLFDRSDQDCKVQIRFVAQNKSQDNEIRNQIIKISKALTRENCLPLVKRLAKLTDQKTKEGLLFFLLGKEKEEIKILITRFPSEVGITVNQNNGYLDFEILNDVFLRKSNKYKAVFYNSSEDFWVGHAVDKQLNDNVGKIREISDYWIKDFLISELKLNSARASSMIAKAIRRTISETDKENIKSELVSVTQTIKNINARTLTMNTFFDELNLSEDTKNEVLSKIENSNLFNVTFQFDNNEFEKNCSYMLKIMDTGAIAMAPTPDFDELWMKEDLSDDGKIKFSTEGKKIREKISNRY